MKRLTLILLLLTSNIYSETINGHSLPPEPDPKINKCTLFEIDPNDHDYGYGYRKWLCTAEMYNEPLFQEIDDKNVESYRFITNQGESDWGDFIRITKDKSTYSLRAGYIDAYGKRKRFISEIKLHEEEWEKAVEAINDINQTILYPPYDDFVIFDAGFTIFESIKEGEVHFVMKNGISFSTKTRNLESFVHARRVLLSIYNKARRNKRPENIIDLETDALKAWTYSDVSCRGRLYFKRILQTL